MEQTCQQLVNNEIGFMNFAKLKSMISNQIQYKNISSRSFKTGKHFLLSYNINILRVNELIKFKYYIKLIYLTYGGCTIPSQSGLWSYANEEVFPHVPELQNQYLTTRCSLVAYLWPCSMEGARDKL